MYQCQYGTCRKTDIFKSEPDIQQHTDRCDDDRNNRIGTHLTADRCTDILMRNLLCYTKITLQHFDDFRTLFICQHSGLDRYCIGTFDLSCLNIVISDNLCDRRFDLVIDLLQLIFFLKRYRERCSARKLQTVIQDVAVCFLIHSHKYSAEQNHS